MDQMIAGSLFALGLSVGMLILLDIGRRTTGPAGKPSIYLTRSQAVI